MQSITFLYLALIKKNHIHDNGIDALALGY